MGTGRTLRKKPRTRPVKSTGQRRRRDKVQKARLVKLGLDPAAVKKMNSSSVRHVLKRPAKIVKAAKAVKAAG